MSDVYQTPESDVAIQSGVDNSEYGSIEDAINGNYKFEIGEVISEAWEKTSGAKLTLILSFIIAIVVQLVVMFVGGMIIGALDLGVAGAIIHQIIVMLIIMPINMGVFLLGVKRSVNAPMEISSIFGHFGKALKLLITAIVMQILVMIGFILLVIPGIYLAIAYCMTMILVIEKDMGVWEALETSRKAVTKRWFSMFLFMLLMGIIVSISAIPFGIGLIWTMPLFMISFAIIYRNMFGVNPETIQE